MDDIIDSFEDYEKAEKISKDIDQVLEKGNFEVKKWVISSEGKFYGEEDCSKGFNGEAMQSVLGLMWDRMKDTLQYNVTLNFSQKEKGMYVEPNVEKSTIAYVLRKGVLTKRILLSKVNSIYDPLGLITPFTINAKFLLKNLWKKKLDWDEKLDEEDEKKLIEFFTSLFDLVDVKFLRCVKPEEAVDKPTLVTFADASMEALGACSYLRWEVKDGSYKSYLVASKSRLSPSKVLSIVRLELCAAVLGARLAKFIEKEMRFNIKETIFVVDSQIVHCMIRRDSYGFNTFVAVRVGEIQELTNINNWFWIAGTLNIADWITRGKLPLELNSDIWQFGPEFLKLPIHCWPVQEPGDLDIPEEKKEVVISVMQKENEENMSLAEKIDIERHSKYRKLINSTARIMQVFYDEKPSLKNIFEPPSSINIEKAELFWVKEAQKSLSDGLKKGNYRRLCPKRIDGVVIVCGRTEKWFKSTYNTEGLILLRHDHRISYLYALWVHSIDHLGVAATICKIRRKFWITHLERLVKSIRYKCVRCRKLDKKLAEQMMSQLPLHRLKPSPAFNDTYVDLFGPFDIRGVVNKRARSKGYGVIYTCGSSRAVYCDISPNYNTDGFLQTTRRFVTIRGYPQNMYSDVGSQIACASKEIQDLRVNLDEKQLKQFGEEMGLTWRFAAPVAPWQNGCAEALIKSVKKCITIAIGDQVLSFPELQTVLFEAANLVNERPIGVHNRNIEDGYLCPNDLLLGRASSRAPAGPFREYTNLKNRHAFVQSIVDCFWKRWIRDYFPSLLVRQKWHTKKRNMNIGDVVLIQDTDAFRGHWKLGKVVKVYTSSDDELVRNVDVQYKGILDKTFTTVKRAVQRLVVLLPVEEDIVVK